MKKPHAKQIDGEWWFTVKHTASLLGVTKKTVETMLIRGYLKGRDEQSGPLVAEQDVTRLRRDATAMQEAKAGSKLPAMPKKERPMPFGTTYVGETKVPHRTKGRIGNPLADEGFGS